MVAMYQFGVTRAVEESAAEASRAFAEFIRGYARARRADFQDDLISQLLIAECDGGRLSEDELASTSILLLNAGDEATVNAIGNGVKALLEHGVDCDGAFATPQSTAASVEELLRLDPPLHLFTRYALEDVEFAGVGLRKGQKVGLLLGAANRDPECFARPDTFDPRGPPIRMSVSAAEFTSASARRWPGWSWGQRWRSSSPVCPDRVQSGRRPVRDAFHFRGLETLRVEWTR